MKILSVDVGHQYLAWASYHVIDGDECVEYGIYNFPENTDCVSRCVAVVNFIQSLADDCTNLIIESQLGLNVRAIELQYALTSVALLLGIEVQLQHALTKFRVFEEICDTRGKAHKKLSVKMASDWLDEIKTSVRVVSEIPFEDYTKQDDVADAINMLRAFLVMNIN
jgi:hypothetical protein